ncbi:Acetyltransferase [Corynebacterium kutscheri]|uniref:Acetyltransferase n=1 Tax=Corynebacterium kutscheri TaxID=35755 RepID=A0AB38VRR2_9CORY|nr:GNAT family N-acetyltransferase [Corynebacterium kutscheri]VEH06188.1 Acetyltransferase [Corynebacterium kutscheri]VEH82101.1 Acetyltransferase [Corynebacterium kutscheri]
MSYIFRSDKVKVGERVVVRSKIFGEFHDVIGHITYLGADELRIRPQAQGGMPSAEEEITIAREEIHIIKKLSPRTVRNSDIRHLELAHALAFPGQEQQWQDQWLLSTGFGSGTQSHYGAPLGASALFQPIPIDEIVDFYQQRQLTPRILIPERIGKQAETLVREQGWRIGSEMLVLTRRLTTVHTAAASPRTHIPDAPSMPLQPGLSMATDLYPLAPPDTQWTFQISEHPDTTWLHDYHQGLALRNLHSNNSTDLLPETTLHLLSAPIDGELGFAELVSDHRRIALARVTITRGLLGYQIVSPVLVREQEKMLTAFNQYLLHWGMAKGATDAYLHVIANNKESIAFYQRLGFIEHHRRRYAVVQ